MIGVHVERVGSIDEFYEIWEGLVIHPVDVDLAFVAIRMDNVLRQEVVDLITHVHIPLGLDVIYEFRGIVVDDVHIQVNLMKITQRIASPNDSSLCSNEGLIVCLHRNCCIRTRCSRF